MSSNSPPGSKKSNYRIRFRHGVYPNTGVEASRADIKKYDYFFETGQKWVETGGNVDFIDESTQVAEETQSSGDVDSVYDGNKRPVRRSTRLRKPETRSRAPSAIGTPQHDPFAGIGTPESLGIPDFTLGLADFGIHTGNNSPTSMSPPMIPIIRTSPSLATTHSESSLDFNFSRSPSPNVSNLALSQPIVSESRIPWPLENPYEARLFRFWVDTASEWWDMTSHRVWKEVLPKLAPTNEILLNAIFMTAAQNMIHVDPCFPLNPLVYHQRVLQGLIPHLAERGFIADEGILAAAMLLRSFEEYRAGTNGQTHLCTLQLLTNNSSSTLLNPNPTPIFQACLMVHIHFEITHSLLGRQSLQLPYESFMLPSLQRPVDDVAWKCRIVWICARILKACDMRVMGIEEWQKLKNMVDEWEKTRPRSFDPFFVGEETEEMGMFYPELWFQTSCHTNANQHLRICRLALAMSRPVTEYGREKLQNLHDWRRRELLRGLKEIISIARCNAYAMCAPPIAAHAIHKFAVAIEDNLVRGQMLESLEVIASSGYPTEPTIQMLKMQWNWVDL